MTRLQSKKNQSKSEFSLISVAKYPMNRSESPVQQGHSKIETSSLRAFWRRYRWRGSLVICFLLEMTSALVVGLQPQISVIWVSNGLLLAYVVLAPRWRWRWYFAAGL